MQSLFPLKDKTDYISCVIYNEDCCSGSCCGNAEVRWNEHNDPTKTSKPLKHLQSNINNCFTWTVISSAQKMVKSLEASFIAL